MQHIEERDKRLTTDEVRTSNAGSTENIFSAPSTPDTRTGINSSEDLSFPSEKASQNTQFNSHPEEAGVHSSDSQLHHDEVEARNVQEIKHIPSIDWSGSTVHRRKVEDINTH